MSNIVNLENEDVIAYAHRNNHLKIGLVEKTRVDQLDDAQDSHCDDLLAEDEAQITWYPSNRSTIVKQKQVYLLDRCLQIGEAVKMYNDKYKIGYIVDIQTTADVMVLPSQKYVLTNVNLRDMTPICKMEMLSANSYTPILFKDWVGCVHTCHVAVLIQPNHKETKEMGRAFWIEIDDEAVLRTAHTGNTTPDNYERDQFYIGQPVEVASETLAEAVWITKNDFDKTYTDISATTSLSKTTHRPSCFTKFVARQMGKGAYYINGSVIKRHVLNIGVVWRHSLGLDMNRPPNKIKHEDFDKIAVLSNYMYTRYETSDRFHYTIKDTDHYLKQTDWSKAMTRSIKESFDEEQRDFKRNLPLISVVEQETDKQSETLVEQDQIEMELQDASIKTNAENSILSAQQQASMTLRKRQRRRVIVKPKRLSRRRVIKKESEMKNEDADRKKAKKAKEFLVGQEQMVEILVTRTTATIRWGDGTLEENVRTTQLEYTDADLDCHFFLPGNIVAKHETIEDRTDFTFGVVRKVDFKERICFVDWYKYNMHFCSLDCQNVQHKLEQEKTASNEMHSVNDLYHHPQFHWIGIGRRAVNIQRATPDDQPKTTTRDRLCQIVKMNLDEATYDVIYFDDNGSTDTVIMTQLVSFETERDWEEWSDDDENEQIFENDLRTASESFMDFEGTPVPVTDVEDCRELNVIDEIEASDDDAWTTVTTRDSKSDTPDFGEEFEDAVEHPLVFNDDNIKRLSKRFSQTTHDVEASPPDSKKDRQEDSVNTGSMMSLNDVVHTDEFMKTPSKSQPDIKPTNDDVIDDIDVLAMTIDKGVETVDSVTTPVLQPIDTIDVNDLHLLPEDQRGTFEVLDKPDDTHYILNNSSALSGASGFGNFWKRVRKEYRLLKTSLPKGIHVRTFEQKGDLFTVLIEGPYGTPYEYGLFLFDIFLSTDYPQSPPQVQYIAFTKERLNPNLYIEGKVCLSLLGTWHGTGSETWDPSKSSLLQLFVSIQALVLNAAPYYNEPSSNARREVAGTSDRSRLYNESAFLLTIEQTLNIIKMNETATFYETAKKHALEKLPKLIMRTNNWTSDDYLPEEHLNDEDSTTRAPAFDLFPMTKGARMTARKWIERLNEQLLKFINNSNSK